MKKKMKPIIITAVTCVVLAAALFAVIKLFPARENVAEQPVVTPGSGESIYIVNKSATLVESIEIRPKDGKKFSINYSTDENGEQIATLKGEGEEFNYNSDDMYTMAGYVGILVAIEEIADVNGRDADFGFNDPKREIKVKFTDNQQVELVLGSDAPSGDGVYIKRKDTGRIYLIGGSTTSMLMKSQVDFRDITMYEKYSSIEQIDEISVQRPGEDKLTVRRKENPEPITDENPTAPQYDVVEPDTADANNDMVENNLFTPLIEIEADSLVEDHPKDLKKYGLKDPVVVTFVDNAKQTHTLRIGDTNEAGKRYIMCDDVPSVLLSAADTSIVNVKFTDLMIQLLWLHNMKDVSQIHYQLPNGEQHILTLSTTDSGTTATYDGSAITSENATNLFMHSIQFTIQGAIDDSMQYGAPEYTMTMTKTNGTTTSLALSRINERQYAVSIDGKTPMYYVNVGQVSALAKAFELIAAGGTVPYIF